MLVSLFAVLAHADDREIAKPSWLDQKPIVNWNKPGGEIPKAPKPDGDPPTVARCGDLVRKPASAADRAVMAAGWTLVGPTQVFSETSVVMGATAVDGMCRPLGWQAFVFVDDAFAGTLSPVEMNSRTDGNVVRIDLWQASHLTAQFSRYAPVDPLCCPSKTSRVGFQVKRDGGPPVVVPAGVTTERGR